MAGSIKLFHYIQNFHQSIGIVEKPKKQKQNSINWQRLSIQICAIQLMLSTGTFLLLEATSMFEGGFAFFMFTVLINSSAVYSALALQLENFSTYIGNCEGFIKKRVNSTIAYRELIAKIDIFNKYFWYSMCVSLTVCVFAPLPYTLVRLFIYDMEDKAYYLYCPSWYPFNWRTPFGYSVAFFAQFVGVTTTGIVYTQFLNLFFGSCWFFMFIAEDISKDVNAFNKSVVQSTDESGAKFTERFCDLIQIYSDAKQCVKEFNHIYEYPLLSFYSWNMMALASMLVTLQFELWGDANSFKVIVVSYVIMAVISYLLILCEPGQMMIMKFQQFEDQLGQCDWQLFPIKMQRMYMVLLSEAQNGMKLSSYGGITCERSTAKEILNKAFSYFMTFRNFRE